MFKFKILFCALLVLSIRAMALEPEPKGDSLLADICDSNSKIINKNKPSEKELWACSKCPSFTAFTGSKENFEMEATYFGSFSGSGKPEVIVSLRGCEPHAVGFGGVALMQKIENKWKRIYYGGSESLARCIPYLTNAKKTELLCLEGDMHGGTFVSWFSQLSFSADGQLVDTQILKDIEFGGNTAGGTLRNGYCYELTPETFSISKVNPLEIEIKGSGGKNRPKSSANYDCEAKMKLNFSFKLNLEFNGSTFKTSSKNNIDLKSIEKFLKPLKVKK